MIDRANTALSGPFAAARPNGKIFLIGYSEGGFVTMAAAKTLQEHGKTVTAAVPCAGSYELSGAMVNDIFSGREAVTPYYVPYTVYGYASVYGSVDPGVWDGDQRPDSDEDPQGNGPLPPAARAVPIPEDFLETIAGDSSNPSWRTDEAPEVRWRYFGIGAYTPFAAVPLGIMEDLVKRGIAFLAILAFYFLPSWGGSIYDDMKNNDFAALRRKVELLDMSLADEPYLAFYLKTAQDFQEPIFEYLLEHGADPNLPDANGVRPIHWAIRNFGSREVAALLGKGASIDFTVNGKDINISDIYCGLLADKGYSSISLSSRGSIWTPIALSVYFQKPEILSLFVNDVDPAASAWLWTEKDARRDQLNLLELPFWNKRPSAKVLSGGAARCFSILWKKNISLPQEQQVQLSSDYDGSLLATLEDDLPALKQYLARDTENSVKYLPYAIVGGSLSCLGFLMEYNDLNGTSLVPAFDLDLVHGAPTDTVPLYAYALMNGDMEMLSWFGARGADFNKQFRYSLARSGGAPYRGQSGALSAAIRMDLGPDFISYLLSKGTDPNFADDSTPLFLALSSGREDIASLLLDAGADPNRRVGRKIAIGQAAMTGSPEILMKCLDKKGNVFLLDSFGWTALHYAVFSGQMEKIKLIVGAKANIWTRSTSEQWWDTIVIPRGSTALDIANILLKSANGDSRQRQFGEIVEYLSALQKPPTKK